MPYILVRHRVRDFATWKPVFDEHGSTRKAHGSKGGYVFRSVHDPTEVLVLLEWESLEKARQFVLSEELPRAMERAGVTEPPDIYFIEEVDRPSA